MINFETIIALTRKSLPDLAHRELKVLTMPGGGSDRQYFRIRNGTGSFIFCQYGTDRAENGHFAEQTDFLAAHGVAVPKILARDLENCRLWIEDLGEEDLWHYREADWEPVRRPLYEATLKEVANIHALTEDGLTDPPVLDRPFDASLYEWEQHYFFDQFAANFSEASEAEVKRLRESAELAELATNLAERPRCLVHRDFQSTNVMIRDGRPIFIDYQGLRFGLAEYDVASLIYDPYVPMTRAEREELIDFAESQSGNPDFRRQFRQCAAQRLMQALGAYGFLGLVKKKRAFLEHIRPALRNLHEVAVEFETVPALAPVLRLKKSAL